MCKEKARIHLGWVRLTWPDSRFDDTNLMSTPEYYEQLLGLRSIDWLRSSILEGYISSAGAGSESVICSSRVALANYVDLASASEMAHLSSDLLTILSSRMPDDRVIIPALTVVAFVLDNEAPDGPGHHRLSYVHILKLLRAAQVHPWLKMAVVGVRFLARCKNAITGPAISPNSSRQFEFTVASLGMARFCMKQLTSFARCCYIHFLWSVMQLTFSRSRMECVRTPADLKNVRSGTRRLMACFCWEAWTICKKSSGPTRLES